MAALAFGLVRMTKQKPKQFDFLPHESSPFRQEDLETIEVVSTLLGRQLVWNGSNFAAAGGRFKTNNGDAA